MTSRPHLATDVNYRNGVGAVLLFAVFAWTFVQAPLPAPQGFGEGSITRSIGFALFDMLELIPAGHGETESFLVALIVIAVVLDAALDGAVMLARREEDGTIVTAIADGGLPIGTGEETPDAAAGDATETPTAEDAAETPTAETPTVEDAADSASADGTVETERTDEAAGTATAQDAAESTPADGGNAAADRGVGGED